MPQLSNGKWIYTKKSIGKGAYSTVYKGYDTETDKVVAIKSIAKHGLSPKVLGLIKNECELLSGLNHQGIIILQGNVETLDHLYFIYEYCPGGDLATVLQDIGKLSEKQAQKYAIQLASALGYLKTKNIVHRDIKPGNLLLSADRQVIKIADFNFARILKSNDLAETLCGSPLYMAPEIINSAKAKTGGYTTSSDLWSVGIVIYEMVYGTTPYHSAKSVIELAKMIETERPVYNDIVVSSSCNDLLEKLLQKDPEKRISWKGFFGHPWVQSIKRDESKNLTEFIVEDYKAIETEFEISDNFEPGSAPATKTPIHYLWKNSTDAFRGAISYITF